MVTSTFSAAPTNATDASFRAWGLGLSTALAAVGMVKTADTGQIDWATVLKPASPSTYQGYEIWRFNDSLQATVPLFFKLEYGSYISSATNPLIRIQCGRGSSGAGVLTGGLTTAGLAGIVSPSATVTPWYVSSGDGSMLAISTAPADLLNGAATLVIERSRSAAGTATGIGLIQVTRNGGTTNSPVVYQRNYSAATGLDTVFWPAAIPASTAGGTASVIGAAAKAPLFPAICADGLGNLWQPRSILVYASLDVGALSVVSVDGWNTYLALGDAGRNFAATVGPSGLAAIGWW